VAAAVALCLAAAVLPCRTAAQASPRLEAVEWLEDPSGRLTAGEVAALPPEAFRPFQGTAAAGFSSAPRWLRFTAVNPALQPQEVALVFRFPMMEELDVWLAGPGGLARARGGLSLPVETREVAFEDGGHVRAFRLEPGERRTGLVRAMTSGAGFLGLELHGARDHRRRSLVSQLALGGLGALLALLLLHARYALETGRRQDLAALGFLTFQGGHLVIASGTLSALWELPPGPLLLAKSAVAALSSFAGCHFLVGFLGTRRRQPRLAAALEACAWISLLTVPPALISATWGGVLVSVAGLAVMALSTAASAEALMAGHRAIRLFLPGLTVFCVSTTWYILSLLGLARPSPLVVLAEILGTLVIAMSMLATFVQRDWWEADARRDHLGRQVAERTATLARTEEALRTEEAERHLAEERFRLAFETNPDAVSITRASDGVVLAANPGFLALHGLRAEEVLGRSTRSLGLWDGGGREEFLARLRAEGAVRDWEVRARLHGEQRTLLLGASLLDQAGEALVLSSSRDVTEQRAAEAVRAHLEDGLRQSQKLEALGRLAAGVAHDFNNLLAVLGTDVALALDEAPPDAPSHAYLVDALETVNRAVGLTRQLLSFTRRRPVEPRPMALDALVRGMEKLLVRLAGDGVTLRLSLPPGLPKVQGDPGQLEQVLLNLVANARDAVRPGGRVTVEVSLVELPGGEGRPDGAHLRLAVEDDGAGMDEQTRQRIFEPFFTTKVEGQGTGLGLATVHGIVRQHGGFVAVRSAPGQGSCFEVFLPIPAAGAAPAHGPSHGARGAA